jgi:hypothetical protein
MEKKEGLGRGQTTKCGAKRQARTCPVTTPQTASDGARAAVKHVILRSRV